MSIVIISILVLAVFHYAGDAKLAWRIASERYDRIRALEAQLRPHLPPAELAFLEEAEAEAEALMQKYQAQKGAFS